MDRFIALVFSGLALGAIYTLVSLGILIIYKATGIVSVAQFGLVALAGYVCFWSVSDVGLPLVLSYLLAVAALAVAGLALERVAYAPLRKRSPDVVLLSTLAGGFAIQGLILLWYGPDARRLPSPFGYGSTEVFGAVISHHALFSVVTTGVAVAALALLFGRTQFGRQVRALAADRNAALLQGIAVNRLSMITFALASAMAGLAGVLLAPFSALTPDIGFTPMLFAFGAAIIGGFGRLSGVVAGALTLGLVEQLGGGYISGNMRAAFPFIAILLVIALRPEGLLGGATRARL
ncbi:branched-chain amino acid ABC transporter permease [Actinomadura sp. SCN-SB]|uniref:branched-chain amino acid ABC transporter permease n=1 Tax=Actinomadura sp. SCN-SB TaxID=3373092 RepID=UPI003750D993